MKWDIRKFIRQAAAAAVAGAMALSISMPALAETWDISNSAVEISYSNGRQMVYGYNVDASTYMTKEDSNPVIVGSTANDMALELDGSSGSVHATLKDVEVSAATQALSAGGDVTLSLEGNNELSGVGNGIAAGTLTLTSSNSGSLNVSGMDGMSVNKLIVDGNATVLAQGVTTAISLPTGNQVLQNVIQIGSNATLKVQNTNNSSSTHYWISRIVDLQSWKRGEYTPAESDIQGTLIYLDADGNEVKRIPSVPVTQYGIRISTDGGKNWVEVDSQNYNNILGNGVLSLQEKNDGTYTLFKNDPLDTGLRIDATEAESAGKTVDVWLVSGIGGDLTISGVRNVTMPNLNNSPITGDASITCSGNVKIYCTMAGSLTVNRANDVTVTKNISGDAKISCTGDVEITAKNSKAVGGKLEYTNKSTEEKVMRNGGELSAIVQKDQTVSNPSTSASSITIKTETKYNVTTNSCTLKSDNSNNAFYEGQLVTAEVQEAVDGDINWTVTADGQDVVYSPSANTISFKMPAHDVTVTAVYKKVPTYPVSVIKGSIVSPEGTEFAKDTAVTLKADAAAEGKQFKGWTGFSDDVEFLNGTSAATETVTFRMLAQNVIVTAEYENTAVTPDPGDPDPNPDIPDPNPDIPDPGAGAGVSDGEMFATGVALTAAGGTVLLGGYFLATELILNHLLPEGTAIPANRAQLALLVWQAAGSPEPAAAPAFADITDTATAKAAQWCIEQGYLKAKADGTFDANGWTPRFQTIQVWNRAFPNGNSQNHAA